MNDPLIGVVSDLRSFVLEGRILKYFFDFYHLKWFEDMSLQILMIFIIDVGVSMSSCITGKSDSCEDEDHVVQQLDRIYQVGGPYVFHNHHFESSYHMLMKYIHICYINFLQKLLQLFVKERIKIEETSWSNKNFCGANGSFCCSLCIVALGQAYGYSCWQDVFPLMDSTSFALDMKLLQELSSVILVNNKRLHLVRPSKLLYSAKIYNHKLYV